MRYSVNTLALAASTICVLLSGCAPEGQVSSAPDDSKPNASDPAASAPVVFVSDYEPIEFEFPHGWNLNPKEHPYDLQCMSPTQEMNTGVFVFRKADIASDKSPIDIFWLQVDDIGSKRRNFEELEEIHTQEFDGKTITSITYTGDKDASRYCYRFSLIEFAADDSTFAVVLQVAMPSDWEKNRPVLESIALSARQVSKQG